MGVCVARRPATHAKPPAVPWEVVGNAARHAPPPARVVAAPTATGARVAAGRAAAGVPQNGSDGGGTGCAPAAACAAAGRSDGAPSGPAQRVERRRRGGARQW